ncbi:uncharacterized protein FIESC28_01008 [Fusarium coffeatum]|uniref:Uncharacterized protein n=1 Tax=Fusarium coffeatum TaxID=231269 RepID=A0A366SC75_9HYPO|nr:uncharacterized protein FIESC28_01008 [Fusarium coffeatum]RBR26225.1 hypothetical protein FIESC28_01008 [Fusarium coffeatum]
MPKQTRLCFLPSGELTYSSEDPLPDYPLLSHAPFWPKLCHNDSSILNAPKLNSKSHLLRLPDEVLQPILQDAVREPVEFSLEQQAYWSFYFDKFDYDDDDDLVMSEPARGWVRYAAIYRLIWVCKRFHTLLLPLMYENVSLDVTTQFFHCPPQEKLFRDEILRRPLLQNYIKHLAVYNQSLQSPIVQLACAFPNINKLSLKRVRNESEIDLSSIGPAEEQLRTASFTHIQFYDLHMRPEAVKRFLEWPKELHGFVVNDMTSDGSSWAYTEPDPAYRWNHALLVDVLSPQKDHLRSLDVGWLGYDHDQNTFQVSAFPNLRSMALTVAYERPNEEACRNWLTPSLNTLILDLHRNDSQCGPSSHNCMRKRGAESIGSFVRMAREWLEKDGSVVGLRRIGIRAYSRGDDAWRDEEEGYCRHDDYDLEMWTNLIQCLKEIETQGFEAFWDGSNLRRFGFHSFDERYLFKNRDQESRRVSEMNPPEKANEATSASELVSEVRSVAGFVEDQPYSCHLGS